ncbi:MAG: helix-turn-helix domain-containing protein [Deltaproteobacteria bacterium]|nr:helix-turn-helix domain-containing protein [Deltaproteobacteria bacterium]
MVDQRGFDNQPWVDADAAATLLGVQRRTLYAYVSRGLVRSAPGARGKARRYDRGDLERLVARHKARAGHGPVAAGALRWGEPVLESSITAIGPRGPSYRGHVAVDLAERGTGLERTSELLWTGTLPEAATWSRGALPWAALAKMASDGAPGAALPLAVVALGLRDPARHDARPDAVLARARAAIPVLAAATSLRHADAAIDAATVAGVLARALLGKSAGRDAIAALDVALVLMADHELNASTFAARVVASTGADLYACFAAALGALSGPRHGAMSARVEGLIDEVGTPRRAASVLRDRLARGDELPGFGHPLYPDGDPRAAPMLRLAQEIGGDLPRVRTALAVAEAGVAVTGVHATCDVSLVALADALGLPRGAAAAMFAIGRTAGWVAHIIEQRAAGFLIRPRARQG